MSEVPKVVLELPAGDTRTANVHWAEMRGDTLHLCISVDAPAQPAAPHGVVYAELPDARAAWSAFERMASDQPTGGNRAAESIVRDYLMQAACVGPYRAPNGQAPAGVAPSIDIKEAARAIAVEVAKNCGSVPQLTFPHIYLGLKDLFTDAPTAQAAPAAGAVAGPNLLDEIQRLAQFADAATRMGPRDMHNNMETLAQELTNLLAAAPTPAAQADSVLEDAARLAKITQAIRDYHFALDNREHGGVAMARAWNAICDVLNMDWVQGAESAARKQGGTQ